MAERIARDGVVFLREGAVDVVLAFAGVCLVDQGSFVWYYFDGGEIL